MIYLKTWGCSTIVLNNSIFLCQYEKNVENTKKYYNELFNKQKAYFKTYETIDINFRIQSLIKLQSAIKKYEKEIINYGEYCWWYFINGL